MENRQIIQREIYSTFETIKDDINFLYIVSDIYTKNLVLNHLWNRVSNLQFLTNLITQVEDSPQLPPTIPLEEPIPAELPLITRQELAKYNGKDGNPAYVAVDGLVYEVTDNATWAAATHFGLTAGKDLTNEFGACHTSQRDILLNLKKVGRLKQ